MSARTTRVSARIAACAAMVLASTGLAIVALSTPTGAKPPKPAIALVKTASISTFVGPGTAVTYSYAVTDSGNTTLTSVGVTDPMPGLSAISCPTTTLAPETSETCTATYTTTQADVDQGFITNTGTASGSYKTTVVTATSSVTLLAVLAPSTCTSDKAEGCIATIPCSTGTCPTVDVGPNTDLRDGQNVSIKVTDFPSTDSFRVALCSGITSATDPSCLAGAWESGTYNPISIPVADNATQDNLTTATYPVFFDPTGQENSLIPALDILQNNNEPGFYCDNTVDPCDIVVTDETGQGPIVGFGPPVSATNSVIIPLTFRALESGCPANTPILNTDSSTSVEQLIPTVVDSTCNQPNGVVALNTTDDTASAVADFASGGSAVSFVDNPMDPTQMTPLQGEAYALIPVAVSASTVSFLAGDILNGLSVPVSTYNLTPNMVAGLINSAYESPEGDPSYTFPGGVQTDNFADSDNLTSALAASGVTCAQLYNCPTSNQLNWLADNLDAFDLVNPLSADSVLKDGVTPQSFGAFMSDVPSGASYETTDWLCHAPNPALNVTVFEPDQQSGNPDATQVTVNDPNSAPSTFTTVPQSSVWPPTGDAHAPWVFPTCAGISDFPSISGTSSQFSAAQSPALQAFKMRGYAYGGGELPLPQNGSDPLAAFGIMDSSEASFWGLGEASLENASGNFEAPTTSSVEAGLEAAQPCVAVSPTCPANTYQFNWSDPDPTAYPMPDITYAIVPTAGVSAATTTAISNLVTNMINFSTSGTLPSGYYPMPTGMATAALAALHTALYASPASSADNARSSSLSNVYTIPASNAPTASSSSTISTLSPNPPTTAATQLTTKGAPSSPVAKAPKGRSRSPVIPVDLSVIILGTASRLLLPSALVVALLCFVGGFLILRRARSNRTRAVAGEVS